jgi:hypothetical protein
MISLLVPLTLFLVPLTIYPNPAYGAGWSGGQQPADGLPRRRHAERLVHGGDVLGEFSLHPFAADIVDVEDWQRRKVLAYARLAQSR